MRSCLLTLICTHLQVRPYLSDLGLLFFCLGAFLPDPVSSLIRVSAVCPLLDCSSILCLSYSRRKTSDRDGGGWNVTGVFISPGSCFESVLLLLRRVDEAFFLPRLKIDRKESTSKLTVGSRFDRDGNARMRFVQHDSASRECLQRKERVIREQSSVIYQLMAGGGEHLRKLQEITSTVVN